MILDSNLVFVDANDAYCKAVQRDKSEIIGKSVFDVFSATPERAALLKDSFVKTLAGETTSIDPQIVSLKIAGDQLDDRMLKIVQFPVRCEEGGVNYMVQRWEDVTEREELRQQRDLVAAELNHRVRNTLAVVQSVAEHTGHASADIEAFLKSFSGRLAAIGRNFAALSESHWQGLDFESIIRTELQPYTGPVLDRISIQGPPLTFSVKATKDTSMLVHELVTNASKYGFLTVPTGKLSIDWTVVDGVLNVSWIETGLVDLRVPDREGFGFQLFDLMPNITVDKRFEPDGLKLMFSVPIKIVEDEITF